MYGPSWQKRWWAAHLPLLEHLELAQYDLTDEDRVLLADMVERRTQIAECHGLTLFRSNGNWLGNGTPAEVRLLRALLPSLRNLSGGVHWHVAFEPCFRDICPPHLKVLEVVADDEAFPSVEVLEAAPALRNFGISVDGHGVAIGAAAFQPVIAALHRGVGLPFLQDINVGNCTIGDGHFCDFLQALKSSGRAERMLALSFVNCGIGVDGARALANLLRGNGLPALEHLILDWNGSIGDEGVVALARGLIEAPRTMLK